MSVERTKHIDMDAFARKLASYTVAEAAAAIEGKAANLAPVGDTGNLRNSMYRKDISDMRSEVGNTADYAVYVEFGTRFMGAQPYLIPAVDETRKQIMRIARAQAQRAANGN